MSRPRTNFSVPCSSPPENGRGRRSRIDYFATSLPSLLLFDDDLDARNRTECRYLTGLAQLGLGNPSVARRAFRDVLAADPNHVGAAARLREPA